MILGLLRVQFPRLPLGSPGQLWVGLSALYHGLPGEHKIFGFPYVERISRKSRLFHIIYSQKNSTCTPKAPKDVQNAPQDVPKGAQRSPKASPRQPKGPPKAPKGTPKGPQRSAKRAKTTPKLPKAGPKLPKAPQREQKVCLRVSPRRPK